MRLQFLTLSMDPLVLCAMLYLNQLYLHIDSSFLLDGFVECIVLVILFKLDKCRMESCKPMMRKLAVFSSTPQCKCYFVPALLENDIVGSSRGLEMNNHF